MASEEYTLCIFCGGTGRVRKGSHVITLDNTAGSSGANYSYNVSYTGD